MGGCYRHLGTKNSRTHHRRTTPTRAMRDLQGHYGCSLHNYCARTLMAVMIHRVTNSLMSFPACCLVDLAATSARDPSHHY
ncbi:hypothetical protein ACHAXS_013620 [Conticribra weissflogii]